MGVLAGKRVMVREVNDDYKRVKPVVALGESDDLRHKVSYPSDEIAA